MEPKLLNFWETGVCEDLTGGMWDWTHAVSPSFENQTPLIPFQINA